MGRWTGCQGAVLRGPFYPALGTRPAPILVMAHGLSATIAITADRHAEVFRESGLAVLLYDHRNFDGSDGEPRHAVNPWLQARGHRDAVSFAASAPGRTEPRFEMRAIDTQRHRRRRITGIIDRLIGFMRR